MTLMTMGGPLSACVSMEKQYWNDFFNVFTYLFGFTGSQSSLTRERTQRPCIGNIESQPLDYQESPGMKFLQVLYWVIWGFPGGASGKEPACRSRRQTRHGFDPRVLRSPGGGHGTPLRYSCLENPMHRGAWQARVHEVAKSQTQLKQLSTHTPTGNLNHL